jgi:hypothetical protein
MQFLQAANPIIMEALVSPVNLPFIAETVGLGDVDLPGEDDRQKQYEEINALINSQPIVMPAPMMGGMEPGMEQMEPPMPPGDEMMPPEGEEMPPSPNGAGGPPMGPGMMPPQDIELPSVEIEPDVDNHEVHILICRSWAVSEAGRLAKIENPDGYKNVLLHLKSHQDYQAMMMAQQQQQEMMMQDQTGGQKGKPQNDKMAAPPERNPNAQPIH